MKLQIYSMSEIQLLAPGIIEEISPTESQNEGAEVKGESESANEEAALLQRLAVRRQSLQKKLADKLESDAKQTSLEDATPNDNTESQTGSDLHGRIKQRLLAMRDSLDREEGVSVEPERVLKGQRGEPSGMNRFQQLAVQSRGSPTPSGKKEDIEMSIIHKPLRKLPPLAIEEGVSKSPVVSFQNEHADITIDPQQSEGDGLDGVFSRHTLDSTEQLDTTERVTTEISVTREEQAIDERFEQDLESAALLASQEALVLLYRLPRYRPQAERIEREKTVLFTKQGIFPREENPVTLQEKQNSEAEIRAAEEEGIYVPEVLLPPRRVWIALEHRILREGAMHWFGEDGHLKGLVGKFKTSSKKGLFQYRDELFSPANAIIQYKPPVSTPILDRYSVLYKPNDSTIVSNNIHLALYLSSLRFTHHWLFNREHMLCCSLYSLQLQYNLLRERDSAEMHYRRMQALRRQLRSLRAEMEKLVLQSLTGIEVENKSSNIHQLKLDIRELRQLRSVELEKEQQLLKSIFKVWGQLKHVRQEQAFVSTAARLRIKKTNVSDIEEDRVNFLTELEEELMELKEEHEEKLSSERISYEVAYDQWRRDQEERDKLLNDSQASALSMPPDTPPPALLPEFDEETARKKLNEEYFATRRHPGQPVLTPELYLNMPVSGQIQEQREVNRRREVDKLSYFIRVKINGETACETKHRKLKQDFIIDFQENFQLELRHRPDSVMLEVYQSSFSPVLMAEVPCPLPTEIPAHKPVTTQLLESLDFTYDKVVQERLGMGAGVASRDGPLLPYTTGVLNSSAQLYGQCTEDSTQRNEWRGYGKLAKMLLDPEKIRATLTSSKLDPNDPRNIPLMQLLRSLPSEDSGNTFRLTRMDLVRPFISHRDFVSNPTFKHLEEKQKFELSPAKSIRFDEELTLLAGSPVRLEPSLSRFHPLSEQDFIPWHPGTEAFYQMIKRDISRQAKMKGPAYTLDEVVVEDPVPNITILRNYMQQLFSPKRPLQPKRVPRRTVPSKHANIRELSLVIRVLQGYNFPSRLVEPVRRGALDSRHMFGRTVTSQWRESSSAHVSSLSGENRQEEVVNSDEDVPNETQPFIEVRFQGTTYRSKQSLGVNPCWNEELIIPYKRSTPSLSFSADSLLASTDILYFNVFDVLRVDALEDERLRANIIKERLQYNWMGSFQVPFHTILVNSRIDGTFKVQAPRMLFGYERAGRVEDTDMQLSLFITLDPLIKPHKSIYATSLDKDDKKLIEKFKHETDSLKISFPDRPYTVSVCDIHGRQVLVNRYINPLNPPDEILPRDELCTLRHLQRISRFVSLIPFLPDSQCLEGLSDIWVPAEEFLKLRCGDEEEHATLLLNYFLFLSIEAWLVLGFGIPEGSTSYVLSRDRANGTFSLWNPSVGERFSPFDPNCPLLHIYTVVSANTIHFNIQSSTKPSEVIFDFGNSRKWRTCVGSEGVPQNSLQPSELIYTPPDIAKALKLQDTIKYRLQFRMEAWRSRMLTHWNRHAGSMLSDQLIKFEESYPDLPEAELKLAFESLFTSYHIVGFPIHLSPSPLKAIEEQVYATGIHTCQEPGVEFVLACYVHPYPSDIYSIWLYLATLVPK